MYMYLKVMIIYRYDFGVLRDLAIYNEIRPDAYAAE